MEVWKDIEWYEWYYQISNYGKVKSLSRFNSIKESFLSPWKCWKVWNVYHRVVLFKDWKWRWFSIHRLIAQAFFWLDIDNKDVLVCHKDDNTLNNKVENIFLWTHKDNMVDMSKKHRSWYQWKLWKLHPLSRQVNQYDLEFNFIKTWDSIMDIERQLWIINTWVVACCRWRSKHSWKFIWKYL